MSIQWSCFTCPDQSSLGILPPPGSLSSVQTLGRADTLTTSSYRQPVVSTQDLQSLMAQLLTSQDSLPTENSSNLTHTPPSQQGTILSPGSDPIPYRLVQRIRSGEFIEMRDLLADNIALHSQLEALHGQMSFSATPAAFRPRLREVPSLNSWMYCFAAYMAVLTTDTRTRELLAYCRLIIREATRHTGNGWQEYDRTFRRQAAIDSSLPWNTLLPGLQATTLIGAHTTPGLFCSLCREPDHIATQCALTVMQQPVRPLPDSLRSVDRRPQRPQRRPETILGICASWNRGNCAFPGSCTYKHVCAVCQLDHQGIECPDAPEGSPYRRIQLARQRPSSASTQPRR